jgi:hypothetical protein
MKNRIISFSLLAAALLVLPAISRAEDETKTNAPEHSATDNRRLPFHGNAAAVDDKAMTVTVGSLVLNVTSQTHIYRNLKPAVLSDIKVGDSVHGSYKKDETGKAIASTITASDKSGVHQKKKPADVSTNAPAAQN